MAWWAGQPVYGSNPVSRWVRENLEYLKTYVDYITNSGVTTADLAAVHATPPSLAAVVNITVNTTLGATDVRIGGGYNISGGIVLTINGAFSAPLTQIFFGTGTVVFAAGSVAEVFPEWWGIDGIADNVQIQAAITAAINVGKVTLLNRTYSLTGGILMNLPRVRLEGAAGMTTLTTAVDIDAITTSAMFVSVRNIWIQNTGASTLAGLKLINGTYDSSFYDVLVTGFGYGYELYSTAALGVAYNRFYTCGAQNCTIDTVYIHHTGAPAWVNENVFFACSLQDNVADHIIYIPSDTNNNKFIGCNIEGSAIGKFAVWDCGLNHYISSRMEVYGYGAYFNNISNSWQSVVSIETTHWQCRTPYIAVEGTAGQSRVHVNNEGTFIGGISAGERVATTVDADSASGQAVLNVTATTNFYVGDVIKINSGGVREEWGQIDSIQAGVSLTLTHNLIYTHTAVQGDAVASRGRKAGINYRAYNMLDFWTYGILVMQIDEAGNMKTLGTQTASSAPTP